jgi:Matrixin
MPPPLASNFFFCGATSLYRLSFSSWLIAVSVSLGSLLSGDTSIACDRCGLVGSTAFHDHALGDDETGARFAPVESAEFGGAAAFAVTGRKWPQPGACGSNCLGEPVTITYSYQNMFDGGLKMPDGQPLPAMSIRKSIEEALGLWASVAPLTFIEVEDDGLTYGQGSTQFGQIRFRHVFLNGPDPVVGNPIAKAQAYYPSSSGTLAGDVEFDHGDPWQVAGTLPKPDILGAAIHELGHSLGLAHSNLPQANMYWIFTRYPGPGSGALHPDDINGVRFIYGAGVGSVVPLVAVPEPAAWALTAMLGVMFFTRFRARIRP